MLLAFAALLVAAPADFRLPPDVVPLEVKLALTVDPAKEDGFDGEETIRVRLPRKTRRIALHGRHLEVKRADVAGVSAAWVVVDDNDGRADLVVDHDVGPGDVDVNVAFHAAYDTNLQGAYRLTAGGDTMVFTQFQAIGARRAFPCFDEPGFKAPLSLTVTTTAGNTVVANGKLASQTKQTFVFDKTAPLPTYLYAFAVGPFDVVDGGVVAANAVRAKPLPLRGIAPRGQGAKMKLTLEVAKDAVTALERYFDLGFPFEKLDLVAVPDFPLGGMENAGLITFRDSFVLVDDHAAIGFIKQHASIVAHEIAHQWFGDLVTPAWWDDIWLNEAFATWITSNHIVDEIRPQFHSRTDARASLAAVTTKDSLLSARRIRQPVQSTDDITNVFDDITYEKGAAVIGMFEADVGEDAFRDGVRAHVRRHAQQTATAKDLLASISTAAKRDIGPAFSTFLDQPGVPLIDLQLRCVKGAPQLSLAQRRYLPTGTKDAAPHTWQVPVCVRYTTTTTASTTPTWATACTTMTKKTATLALPGASCTTTVHGNADGRGYYRWSMPAAAMRALSTSTSSLTAGERISFGDAVRAAYDNGSLSFKDALTAALPLGDDEEPAVAGVPGTLLRDALDHFVDVAARPAVQAKIAAVYLPVLERLGLVPKVDEDARTRELRALVLRALVNDAEHAPTVAALAPFGRAFLGVDVAGGGVHDDACPRDLQDVAVISALRTGGAATADAVVELLGREQDGRVRLLLLRGLGRVFDDESAARARALALDPRVRNAEAFITLFPQARDTRTHDATWAWFKDHVDVLAGKLPPEWGGDALYRVFDGDCTAAQAAAVETFFATKTLPGGARPVRQLVESIRRCDARRAVQQKGAQALFR